MLYLSKRVDVQPGAQKQFLALLVSGPLEWPLTDSDHSLQWYLLLNYCLVISIVELRADYYGRFGVWLPY